ncbi:MAG: hypothetical protein M3Q81_00230 [bacterium]|nr:hypothetical protein [bacterium]
MQIKAFGEQVSRQKAYEVIINDRISDICHSRNTEILADLLVEGWAGLIHWDDKDLEEYIGTLSIENQPDGKK